VMSPVSYLMRGAAPLPCKLLKRCFKGLEINPEIIYSISNERGLSYPKHLTYIRLYGGEVLSFPFPLPLFSLEPSVLLPRTTLHSFLPASQLITFFRDSSLIALHTHFFPFNIYPSDIHQLHHFAILSNIASYQPCVTLVSPLSLCFCPPLQPRNYP
jgi:hypothetical protein